MEPKADKEQQIGMPKWWMDQFPPPILLSHDAKIIAEPEAIEAVQRTQVGRRVSWLPFSRTAPLDTFSLSAAIVDAIQKHPEEAKYPRDLRNVIEEAIKTFVEITVERI